MTTSPKRGRGAGKRHTPPIPSEQLDSLMAAVKRHALTGKPMPRDVALATFWALARLRHGKPPVRRATEQDMRAATIARDMADLFKCPVEDAIAAAFGVSDDDLDRARRNYSNLLKIVGAQPLSGAYADIPATFEAYRRTAHYAKHWEAKSRKPES